MLALTACGGGSSDSGGSSETPSDDEVSGESGVGAESNAESMAAGVGGAVGDLPGSSATTDTDADMPDVDMLPGAEAEPGDGVTTASTVMDAPVPIANGLLVRAIISERGPVIGVPGAVLEDLGPVVVRPSSALAFSGTYRQESQRLNGLWSGTVDIPALVASTGTALSGVPDNVRFGSASTVDITDDGSLGFAVKFSGAREDDGYVVRQAGPLPDAPPGPLEVILSNGDTLSGLDGIETMEGIDGAVLSSAGLAIALDVETSDNGSYTALYLRTADSILPIIRGISRVNSTDPLLPTTNCRITFRESFNNEARFDLTDAGDLVFEARMNGGNTSTDCAGGDAVVTYKAGTYESVVRDGSIVPGAPNSRFDNVDLASVTEDGTAIVTADLRTPTGSFQDDVSTSLWAFPLVGDAQLIALEGEEVEINGVTATLPNLARSQLVVRTGTTGRIALKVDIDGDEVLYGGTARIGQPHPDIPAPGAAALDQVTSTNGLAPAPFDTTAFYDDLGAPSVGLDGATFFYGRLVDSVSGESVSDSIWRADGIGSIIPLISEGDMLIIGGVENELQRLTSSNGDRLINQTDAGDILFRGSVSSSAIDVLVQLKPAQ